jgi:hypothetical protein
MDKAGLDVYLGSLSADLVLDTGCLLSLAQLCFDPPRASYRAYFVIDAPGSR